METNDLTKPERLFLDRLRAGLTQRITSERWGVSLYVYRNWENGIGDVPDVELDDLKVHEEYRIRRHREGVSVKEFAERLGISRWWLIRSEAGTANLTRLANYWEAG